MPSTDIMKRQAVDEIECLDMLLTGLSDEEAAWLNENEACDESMPFREFLKKKGIIP
jgi:hypothetical protein